MANRNDLGFKSYIEYEVPNLLNDGYKRFISVVWKEGSEIVVAFQIRRKKRRMDIITSLHSIRKLEMLPARRKYIINVSQKDGTANFFNIEDAKAQLDSGDKAKLENLKTDRKTFDLNAIRVKYHRAYESWSDSEDRELIDQYNQRMSISEIYRIHQRQRSAIRARINKKIGLK